jgi:hypothetical protein
MLDEERISSRDRKKFNSFHLFQEIMTVVRSSAFFCNIVVSHDPSLHLLTNTK